MTTKSKVHDSLSDQIQNFDTEAAMQLVHAFHSQPSLDALLSLVFKQTVVLATVAGLHYQRELTRSTGTLDREFGRRARHSARYRLQWPEGDLGTITLFFERPAPEHALSTAEDLIALMSGALRNVLRLKNEASCEPTAPSRSAKQRSEESQMHSALQGEDQRDSLILVAVDGFEAIRERSGEAWAQAIVDSVQAMLEDALREADGVYQIRTGLLAVLLPRTGGRAAALVAEKLRVLLGTVHLSNDSISDQLTACMGIATSRRQDDAKTVLRRAEEALKLARLSGPGSISEGRLRLVT